MVKELFCLDSRGIQWGGDQCDNDDNNPIYLLVVVEAQSHPLLGSVQYPKAPRRVATAAVTIAAKENGAKGGMRWPNWDILPHPCSSVGPMGLKMTRATINIPARVREPWTLPISESATKDDVDEDGGDHGVR